MHVKSQVVKFKDDMKALMDEFLKHKRGEVVEQPATRQWKWCELLLAGFMRNKVAPSCDAETVEDLDWWRGMCVKPGENLVERFHEMCYELKPPVLAEINFPFPDSPKKFFASIFVIDWMVRSSPWALRRMAEKGWRGQQRHGPLRLTLQSCHGYEGLRYDTIYYSPLSFASNL